MPSAVRHSTAKRPMPASGLTGAQRVYEHESCLRVHGVQDEPVRGMTALGRQGVPACWLDLLDGTSAVRPRTWGVGRNRRASKARPDGMADDRSPIKVRQP